MQHQQTSTLKLYGAVEEAFEEEEEEDTEEDSEETEEDTEEEATETEVMMPDKELSPSLKATSLVKENQRRSESLIQRSSERSSNATIVKPSLTWQTSVQSPMSPWLVSPRT